MTNGLDPEKGRLLVPFDLKADVIQPLERLEDKLERLDETMRAHTSLPYHESNPFTKWAEQQLRAKKEKEERWSKRKQWITWGATAAGAAVASLIAALQGGSG